MKKITRRGFTLIEVLVVITIIGILSTVVFANFSGARDDAKNKSLAAEMKEVQLAIELYRAQKGNYPPEYDTVDPGCGEDLVGKRTSDTVSCLGATVIDELVPEFIADLPDISSSGNSNCNLKYFVDDTNGGAYYKLVAENCFAGAAMASEGVQSDSPLARCPSTCNIITYPACDPSSSGFFNSYAIYSASAAGEGLCL